MKIAFIVGRFPALSETFILNQITGLLNLGHDIEIFAVSKNNENKVHPNIEKYNLMEKAHYIEPPFNKIKRIFRAIYLITTNFHKEPLKILRALNIFKYGRTVLSLRKLYYLIPFLGKKFDIIQCHFGFIGNIGAFLKQVGIDGKLVTMFHGYDIRLATEKGGKIYERLFEQGDCFLAISNYNYRKIVQFGANPNKVIFHPVGIDIDKFPFKRKEKEKISSHVRILTVARLVEEKGLKYSILSINEILKKSTAFTLKYYIVGEGPLRETLNDLIKELKIENTVKILGSMDQTQVVKEMLNADIFLLPSISEVLPVVLMEAQAVGLPVIASNVGSIADIILDGKSGYLVPEGDVAALTERLDYLIEHPEFWSDMGQRGSQFVKEHYDINNLNKKLVEIYQNLIKDK